MNTSKEPVVEVKSFRSEGMEGAPKWQEICEAAAKSKSTPAFGLSNFIAEFEEKELVELADTSSALYTTFFQRMKSVAITADVNLFVYVGHINYCYFYLDELKSRVEKGELVIPNKLPTVILIIGCFGESYLNDYLQDPKFEVLRDLNIHSFGFHDLVHIYKGKIFNCKKPHYKIPRVNCKHVETPEGQKECCEAKQGSFEKNFLEYLNERSCTEISNDKLIEKFRYLHTKTEFDTSFYLFGATDGTPCTKTEPCIVPNSRLINLNQKSKAFNALTQNFDDMWVELIDYCNDPNHTTKEKIDNLRKLKKTEVPVLVYEYTLSSARLKNYSNNSFIRREITYENNTLLTYLLSMYNYEIAYYILTQKMIEIPNLPLVAGVLLSLYIYDYEPPYREKKNFLPWQMYNLLTILYEKDPSVFTKFIEIPGSFQKKTPFLISLKGKYHPTLFAFFYTHLKEKVNWDQLSSFSTKQDRDSELWHHLRFEFGPHTYYILYLALMGCNLNALPISFFHNQLENLPKYSDSKDDLLYYIEMFKTVFAFGYNTYAWYLKQIISKGQFVYKDDTTMNNKQKNDKNELIRTEMISLLYGSDTYDKDYANLVKEKGRNHFEKAIMEHSAEYHFTENLEARKQFSKLQGEIGKLLKKLPESERETYFKRVDDIIYNAGQSEWERLQELQKTILETLQADPRTKPHHNTTLRNKLGGYRRRHRKTRRNR